MGFYSTVAEPQKVRQEKLTCTQKTASREIFCYSLKSSPKNRSQAPELHQRNRLTTTKVASGIPYWPNRDPLTDEMFLWQVVNLGPFKREHLEWLNSAIYGNVYSFVNNQPTNTHDILGLLPPGGNGQWGGWHPPLLPGVTKPSQGNCWRYACNDPAKLGEPHSPFPGGSDPRGVLTCDQVKKGAKADGAKEPDAKGDCPKCHYKVKLVLQPDNGNGWNDYHWYRQDDDGTWSHKPGQTDVIPGVTDPTQDAKNRGYTTDCGELCVPEKGTDTD